MAVVGLTEQMRLHVVEHTGLPRALVDRVCDACSDFWLLRYPDLARDADQLVREMEDR